MFNSLGPLENDVMEVVWRKKSVTVKDVVEELKTRHKLAYTTVLTILSRLWKKGVLERSKTGKSFTYTPKVDRQQTVQSIIRSTLHSMVDKYGDEAISAFIDEVSSLKKENIS